MAKYYTVSELANKILTVAPTSNLQDITNRIIQGNAPLSAGQVLYNLITEDENSDFKTDMAKGEEYFQVDNDINDTDFTMYTDVRGNAAYFSNKANNHINHGFHRRQVLEKVAYLLKSPLAISHEDDMVEEAQDDGTVKQIQRKDGIAKQFSDTLGQDFDDIMVDWGTGASNKGLEWVHVFPYKNEFDYMVIDSREIIPIYETSKQKELVELIRYYTVTVNEAGVETDRYRVEWWFPDRVDFYEEDRSNNILKVDSKPHFTVSNTATNEMGNLSWGRVPYIPLKNNSNQLPDLNVIKSMIDSYDRNVSEFDNNLQDLKEALHVFRGTSDTPEEAKDHLDRFNVVVFPDNEGGVDKLTIDLPSVARMEHLKNLEENAYALGMAINPKTDRFGNDPSGVMLKWMYLPLDLKAGMLERKFQQALYDLMWFANKFREIKGEETADVSLFTFTFNKSMIANEKEQIELSIQSKGTVSDDTILEHHPWVDDVEVEKERLEVQKANEPTFDLEALNMGDEDEDEEEIATG
jgi:SPP1 family phage portal protein